MCTFCTNVYEWYLPTARMLLCQVLQVGYGSVRDFLNSFNAITCGVVVLPCCRVVVLSCCRVAVLPCCRVDNCCFGQSMSPIVGGVVATTATATVHLVMLDRRSMQIHSPTLLFCQSYFVSQALLAASSMLSALKVGVTFVIDVVIVFFLLLLPV